MRHFWVIAVFVGCGSVNGTSPDARLMDAIGKMDAAGLFDAASHLDAIRDASGPPVAPGTVRWARSLSSVGPLGLAEGTGGLVVAGYITAPAQLGGDTLLPVGGPAMVVAGFDSDTAAHLYSKAHGGPDQAYGFVQDVISNGTPIVLGVTYGTTDVGLGPITSGGNPALADGYIGLYSVGTARWVKRLVGPGEDKIVATALGPSSSVYGVGWFEQTTSFNGGSLVTHGSRDLFVARFNAFTGDVQLTQTYGGPGLDEISSAAASGDHLIVAGHFDETTGLTTPGTLAFGGSALPLSSHGGRDLWVAELDSQGNGMWAVAFGGPGEDRGATVAVDAAGDVYLAGTFTGQVAFGAVNLTSRGDVDVFLAKLHGNTGSVAWAISFGSVEPGSGTRVDGVGGLAVDAAGHVTVAGNTAGPLEGASSAGGRDGFIASFDTATGAAHWRTIISTAGEDGAGRLVYGRNGDLYATVEIGAPFDFGTPIIGAPSPANVLLRIAP